MNYNFLFKIIKELYPFLNLPKIEYINKSDIFDNDEKDFITFLYLNRKEMVELYNLSIQYDKKKESIQNFQKRDSILSEEIQNILEEIRNTCNDYYCFFEINEIIKNIENINSKINLFDSYDDDNNLFKPGTLFQRHQLKTKIERLINKLKENKSSIEKIEKEIKEIESKISKSNFIQIFDKIPNKLIKKLQTS